MRVSLIVSLFLVGCAGVGADPSTPGELVIISGSLAPIDPLDPEGPWQGAEVVESMDTDCASRQPLSAVPVASDCEFCTLSFSLTFEPPTVEPPTEDGCAVEPLAFGSEPILLYAPSEDGSGLAWLDVGSTFESFGYASMEGDRLTWRRFVRVGEDGRIGEVSLRELREVEPEWDP